MSRHRRPFRTLTGVAGAVALSGLLLSGCGAGQITQTATQVAATNGANASVGPVDLRDVQIAYPQAPASPAALYYAGGSAPVRATLSNDGATVDRLVSVSSPFAARVRIDGERVMPQKLPIVAVAGQPLQPTHGRPFSITLDGLTQAVAPGAVVPMTFVFANAGSVTVQVPTAIPQEQQPGAAPERDESAGEPGPAPAGAPAATPGEGAEAPPGNEGTGSGGVAGEGGN